MKNDSKKEKEMKSDFISEYQEIINSSEKSVVIETQWEKDGDFFQKFTTYDNSYIPVKTLGSTTLIKAL